jgi:putative phosphoribosyl transferase
MTAFLQAPFVDRTEAGDALALSLSMFASEPDVVVLGLARGGVPVARQVADGLDAPMGVLVSRNIGVPGIEDVALGAIVEGTDSIVTDSIAWFIGVPSHIIGRLAAHERPELERRARLYRGGLPLPDLRGRRVILVDDGLATGATLRAAARAIRAQRPKQLIVAAPVASRRLVDEVRPAVDEFVTVIAPEDVESVPALYEDYLPVTDEEVLSVLGRRVGGKPSAIVRDVSDRITYAPHYGIGARAGRERRVEIAVGAGHIVGDLGMPRHASNPSAMNLVDEVRGLAILAHGTGAGRDSYHIRYIAGRLRLSGYATLRLDLLMPVEYACGLARLSARLSAACEWTVKKGVSGASRLAPVMLVVDDADVAALLNSEEAIRALPRRARLVHIPRAGQGVDEPGALGAAAEHAVAWLDQLYRTQ